MNSKTFRWLCAPVLLAGCGVAARQVTIDHYSDASHGPDTRGTKGTPSYPELQAQSAGSLEQVGTSGVFVSGLKSVQSRPSPVISKSPCIKACATTITMWVQVSYPITVCFAPDFTTQSIKTLYREGNNPDTLAAIVASKTPVTHQVSRRTGASELLYCKTNNGPWYAEMVDQELCSGGCGPGEQKWSMVILGVQQTLYWEWWGALEGRPQQVEFYGEPWIRSHAFTDCNVGDLTKCN